MDRKPKNDNIEEIALFIKKRERQRLFYTVASTAVAALLGLVVIASSSFYVGVSFEKAARASALAAEAEETVRALEERRVALETEIATKTAQLKSLGDQLKTANAAPEVQNIGQIAVQQATLGTKLVYLQFRGAISRDTMRGLQSQLRQDSYIAPGIERVAQQYGNEVRYFRPEDEANAKNVAKIVTDYFSGRCTQSPNRTFVAALTKQKAGSIPPPQIEVWVSLNCGEN